MTKRSKKGLALAEYALGLGAISAAIIIALGVLGENLGGVVANIANSFNCTWDKTKCPEDTFKECGTPWNSHCDR